MAQFPALSHSSWVLVKAFAVSVPAATLVVSVKLAGELALSPDSGLAGELALSPDSGSLAVQGMVTSVACQAPSGDPQLMIGGVVSGDVFGGTTRLSTAWMMLLACAEEITPSFTSPLTSCVVRLAPEIEGF